MWIVKRGGCATVFNSFRPAYLFCMAQPGSKLPYFIPRFWAQTWVGIGYRGY